MSYELIDSGNLQKLERFGPYLFIRPCFQALWQPTHPDAWKNVDMAFSRKKEDHWEKYKKVPAEWIIEYQKIRLKIAPSDFGHVGFFPEHAFLWQWIQKKLQQTKKSNLQILNLFAYTGAATIALAKEKAKVCHVDASRPMILRAKENMQMNHLQKAPIRWILDDVMKFLQREIKRKNVYDGIILDPPTFGRGPKGQVFKLEKDLFPLLQMCNKILSKKALFLVVSTHTPGITATVLSHILKQTLPKGSITAGEMLIPTKKGYSLPSGFYSIWEK